MNEKSVEKIGGISSIILGFIYISAFIVYGGILNIPSSSAEPAELIAYLTENHLILAIVNFTSYVLFGIFLLILVVTMFHYLKKSSLIPTQIATAFGVIWVGLVIASGMIANIGLDVIIEKGATDPHRAILIFSSMNIVTEGLGGGNEIVGGIWVLLLSIIALKRKKLSQKLNIVGLSVGIVGILTIFPLDLFTEIFGVGQILWFLWLGLILTKS